VLYLFKNRFFCTDIFKHLHDRMTLLGYQTARVIDEDHVDSRNLIDRLKGLDITLITSDHLNDNMEWYGQKAYSIRDCERILEPKRKVFGIHDIGISTIDDDVDGYIVIVPDASWSELFYKFKNISLHPLGHPKFLGLRSSIRYPVVFFVSSVYVYARAQPRDFLEAFPLIFKHKIPFKFPKYVLSKGLVDIVKNEGIEIIDSNLETFDVLLETGVAISNANSSVGVEAAIAGCKSINIGWDYKPTSIYSRFNILSVNEPNIGGFNSAHLEPNDGFDDHTDLIFDIDKCIEIITKD
jgi:hypothetical protein